MNDSKYIVGIDLGTTNSVLAYTQAEFDANKIPEIHIFEIPQLLGPGAVAGRTMLPSFIFLPTDQNLAQESLILPWRDHAKEIIGEWARERGAEIPQRLISSAKSWLCNTMVDREHAILPWGASSEVPKLSPIEASARILDHIRRSWNFSMAGNDENLRLERQDIYLTVPASFDAVARELTVRAAEIAKLPHITLLEEPQAAFYAWIEASGDAWRDEVAPGDLVLVCDLGGGTSDFSLIRVSEAGASGDLELERIAVGNHLLVGGDNMDLALAYAVAGNLSSKGTRLDSWQMRELWYRCRSAKEKLMAPSAEDNAPISILGRGSSLIGGALRTDLTRQIVEQVILDGFFPFCETTSRPAATRRTGIQETGLSYESDPAVTRHLARFLSRQDDRPRELPTAVLFNGGVMKGPLLRKRILDVISSWQEEGQGLRELQSSDLDLAVARGAAYYGAARRGRGIRIRSGLNKSYYIGVAASLPAVPGMPAPIKVLCVAPFGMEEGSETELTEREFHLVVGEPASFEFFGSATRLEDAVGTLIEDWEGEIEPITTIETTLEGEHGNVIPVAIQGRLTETGALELWCVSRQDGKRWKLEFNVREHK